MCEKIVKSYVCKQCFRNVSRFSVLKRQLLADVDGGIGNVMVFDVGEVPETSRKRPLLSIARTPLANRKKLFTTETKRPGVAVSCI